MKDQVIDEALNKLGCPARVQDRLEAFGVGVSSGITFIFDNFDVRLKPVEEDTSAKVQTKHPGPVQRDGGQPGEKD
jgi:hypothetical protein